LKFFVQCKHPNNSVDCGMFTGQQVLEMVGARGLTGCEYKVYDVSRFGEAEMLTYVKPVDAPSNFHDFHNKRGDSLISGYFPEE